MNTPKIRAIITGATGMVGEGVLHECLLHPAVEAVLIINRKPTGLAHPKLKEIVHADFYNLSAIESQLTGYNACFFCLGVSSVGMNEGDYYKLTYTLTMHVATTLSRQNPEMTFCYISGAGTDSTEKGRSMWARVKGKTENDLAKLPFKRVFNFRPGFIKPTEGLKNTLTMYRYVGWLFPIGRALYPAGFCTLKELGTAMIKATGIGYEKQILEGKDIIELANR
ncbi:NAD-dependent epimerase/dehydratase family protein [Larkinella sp. VNQ87]|uniref:NAD-dependent epimerase/dehydratase family protein n=1 Tax=Larkinella sp. VNQ87 TaxID=3400921 RepID=UPI003BFC8E3C